MPEATPAVPMPTWRWPLAYASAAIVFLAMDAVWLGATHAALYGPALGHLLSGTVDWTAAGVFYALYVAGLLVFAVAPALASGRPASAFWRGALLGLLAYATYDLTNQATLKDWPWHVTLVDLAWGAIVSGSAAGAAAVVTAITCRRARRTSGR